MKNWKKKLKGKEKVSFLFPTYLSCVHVSIAVFCIFLLFLLSGSKPAYVIM